MWKPEASKGECGIRSTKSRRKRVVGGRKVRLGELPYNVLIGYETDLGKATDGIEVFYLAAGSVINKWYILTGAATIETVNGPLT